MDPIASRMHEMKMKSGATKTPGACMSWRVLKKFWEQRIRWNRTRYWANKISTNVKNRINSKLKSLPTEHWTGSTKPGQRNLTHSRSRHKNSVSWWISKCYRRRRQVSNLLQTYGCWKKRSCTPTSSNGNLALKAQRSSTVHFSDENLKWRLHFNIFKQFTKLKIIILLYSSCGVLGFWGFGVLGLGFRV